MPSVKATTLGKGVIFAERRAGDTRQSLTSLPSVVRLTLGKEFFFFGPPTFSSLHTQHVVLHVQAWCFFEFMCYIWIIIFIFCNFLNKDKFELQVIRIYEKNEGKIDIHGIQPKLGPYP